MWMMLLHLHVNLNADDADVILTNRFDSWTESLKTDKSKAVIFIPAHPASFTHNFVSGMQSFYFSESQGAIVFQTYNET